MSWNPLAQVTQIKYLVVKSPTAQDKFWSIPGLARCTGMTGKYPMYKIWSEANSINIVSIVVLVGM